jgi:hypothetical protein
MGSAAVDGATLGFVSRLVIRAVVMHVEKTRPDYWIHSISFGSLLNWDAVLVARVEVRGPGGSELVTVGVQTNPTMAPFVGSVYTMP